MGIVTLFHLSLKAMGEGILSRPLEIFFYILMQSVYFWALLLLLIIALLKYILLQEQNGGWGRNENLKKIKTKESFLAIAEKAEECRLQLCNPYCCAAACVKHVKNVLGLVFFGLCVCFFLFVFVGAKFLGSNVRLIS